MKEYVIGFYITAIAVAFYWEDIVNYLLNL